MREKIKMVKVQILKGFLDYFPVILNFRKRIFLLHIHRTDGRAHNGKKALFWFKLRFSLQVNVNQEKKLNSEKIKIKLPKLTSKRI